MSATYASPSGVMHSLPSGMGAVVVVRKEPTTRSLVIRGNIGGSPGLTYVLTITPSALKWVCGPSPRSRPLPTPRTLTWWRVT